MNNTTEKKAALVLAGGGARNAYQVGVLKALTEILPDNFGNPFKIITGTSSGGINAGVLAANAHDIQPAITYLADLWSNLNTNDIFKADKVSNLRAAAALIWSYAKAKSVEHQPASIFDNAPLATLLAKNIDLQQIQHNLDNGDLHALGITSSSYTTGRSVTHFMANQDVQEWKRSRRCGLRSDLSIDHFMASSAIPLVFPAVKIGNEYYGDGSMRQLAPLSTGLRLGADKLFVISVSNRQHELDSISSKPASLPSAGAIAGYIFETLFMEALEIDLERMNRINYLTRLSETSLKDQSGQTLKAVDCLVMTPSQDLCSIINKHANLFPKDMHLTLRLLGGNNEATQLASYLCFEGPFCQELIQLGYDDAYGREVELRNFFLDKNDNQYTMVS